MKSRTRRSYYEECIVEGCDQEEVDELNEGARELIWGIHKQVAMDDRKAVMDDFVVGVNKHAENVRGTDRDVDEELRDADSDGAVGVSAG